ncbi:hypothetical protein C4D60_Mb08t25580 [Musa balbisiana]|uniref:Uncharacterized protein n=1 Tax=Musa balbisiana TaxID=52838 RepID=A0A4S8K6F7_MUSBA|nr:hypothetical protein C4D60_Mb08t25580 [Musa balbisiana]
MSSGSTNQRYCVPSFTHSCLPSKPSGSSYRLSISTISSHSPASSSLFTLALKSSTSFWSLKVS